jgi:hypothetical protein
MGSFAHFVRSAPVSADVRWLSLRHPGAFKDWAESGGAVERM